MYCQTSSSVQFESGKTRRLSPGCDASVEKVPEFGALVPRVPLAARVAEGEDSLLGAGALFVAACSAEGCVKAACTQAVEESRGF